MSRRLPFLLLATVMAPAASTPANDPLEALRTLDIRMIDVGTRLAVSNLALCDRRQWQSGLTVHDLSQYSGLSRAQAATRFGLAAGTGVFAMAPGGPAARAGLRQDDTVLAADGAPLPRALPRRGGPPSLIEAILDSLEMAFIDGDATLSVVRGGRAATIRILAEEGCASRFQVLPSARLDARADGRYVQLTSAMIEFTRDDHELSALVAHELAHNILRHRERLNDAGVERGLLAALGRSGRLFRQTELEADRLTVHLMTRAGFDPAAAVRLWRRQAHADSRLFAGTHPDWPARIAALEAELAAIAAARRAGGVAAPPLPRGPLGVGPG